MRMLEWRLIFRSLSGTKASVSRFTFRESHVGELCFKFGRQSRLYRFDINNPVEIC